MPIHDKTLQELFPISLESTPCVILRKENKVWVAAAMLVHYLESFTDSIVIVDENNKPIGLVGGKEVIENVYKNPSSDFFDNKTVGDIMSKHLPVISKETTLHELIEKWKQTGRAFSIIPNSYGGHSAISARKLLEVGAHCKTDLMISDLPKKKMITFKYDDVISDIIKLMLDNKTRKLIFKNTAGFISDRILIQTMVQELNYLRGTYQFLDSKFEEPFKLADAKQLEKDMNLAALSKIMFGMMHPCVIFKDQVITPFDICIGLLSERILDYQH